MLVFISNNLFAAADNATNKTQAIIPLDRTVAIVNDEVILNSELTTQIAHMKAKLTQEKATMPSDKELRKQILQQMIDTKLQLQFATRTGVKISNSELNKAITQIAKQNKQTTKELYASVKKQGWTIAGFRQEIKNEGLAQKLANRAVSSKIRISPQEIDDALKAAISSSQTMPDYHLTNILVPIPDTPTPNQVSQAQQQAEKLVAQLKAGADFQKTSEEKLNGEVLQGGDLGWRKLPELPEAFEKHVTKMKIGDIAGPIKTPNGFHIIKLLGVKQNKVKNTITEAKIQMIFIKQTKKMTTTNLTKQLAHILNKIINGATFDKLARKYSQDKETAKAGGNVASWVQPGKLPKAVDTAINKLKPGEISQPIITDKGGYIIKIIAKQQAAKSTKEQKNEITQMIFQRKLQEGTMSFINELRGQSYVKVI